MKHNGELPIVGVNTFLNKKGSPTMLPGEVIRSTPEEKDQQIRNWRAFCQRNEARSGGVLEKLKEKAVENGNLFAEVMGKVKYWDLGEETNEFYYNCGY